MIQWFNRFLAWVARNIKRIIGMVGLVVIMALIFTTAYSQGYHFMRSDSYAVKDENARTVTVEIPKEATFNDIANILQNRGLIEDTWEFKVKSKLSGADDEFKFGIYYIQEGASVEEIIAILKSGDQSDVVPIHIVAGATIDEIAEQLEENGICTANSFKRAANMTSYSVDMIRNMEVNPDSRYALEGYMMPGTYQIIKDSDASNVVKAFLDRFISEYSASLQQKVEESGYTLGQVLTLASVVESECAVQSDYEIFASMLLNRIRSRKESLAYWSMPSTVLYAQMRYDDAITAVTEADKGYTSPYNTYLNQGFPPSPICNPSIDAIRAVLYPAETNYLYYEIDLTNQDGARHFSETETEHDNYLNAQQE